MSRKREFVTGEIYHIYNRGVDHRSIFQDQQDYRHFKSLLKAINTIEPIGSLYHHNVIKIQNNATELVSFLAFCLLPNHFHLALKQQTDGGITLFMRKLSAGYTSYFNNKQGRTGGLFEGTFQCVPIKGEAQHNYTITYIIGNAEIHGIAKAHEWPWCSYHQTVAYGGDVEYIKQVISDSKFHKKSLREDDMK